MVCGEKLAAAAAPPDIDYLFAPLKAARLDYVAQKATEMGARRLRPVITARTIVSRLKIERLQANAVEAAEQCNLVWVPEVLAEEPLARILDHWDAGRRLIFCDDAGAGASPLGVLKAMAPGPLAVLVGPEGGFTSKSKAAFLPCLSSCRSARPPHHARRYRRGAHYGAGAGHPGRLGLT